MAFLEWRKFNFFDIVPNVDQSKINECLKDKTVTSASSGYGHIVLGDSDGFIHLVNRFYDVKSFQAFFIRVCLVEQAKHSPLLVAIGDEEAGVNPQIKVWKLDKLDQHGAPMCVRMCRAIPGTKPTTATVICLHENLNLMAVGYADGSIVLHRGDVTRDRAVKKKVLKENNLHSITGLAFRSTAKMTYLYACTAVSVFVYNVTVKDKEQKTELDQFGCEKNCSTLADSTHDRHFLIGRDTAVYCYMPDGRGPCYAVEGSKVMLQWFRNYLVIVAKDSKLPLRATSSSTPTTENAESAVSDSHIVTVLDIQNMFIVLSTPLRHVKAVLAEWGSLYVLTNQGSHVLYHLSEKDLQSKLTDLFQKNLYDVAIRIARSHKYDSDGLAEIFRQYGDHLYRIRDHAGAIEQYVKTIGRIEPSYVIRKFLDSQHIENLTTYLQALHKNGAANEDHTILLLNCYTKLDKTEKLKEFIMTENRELDFDVEIAIKVCRQASSEDALLLAEKHRKHDWYLRIQTEDHSRFKEALEYITKLEFTEAETYMTKYGTVLLKNEPEKTTEFLKKLCTDYMPADKPLLDKVKVDQADPADFIHLFLNCPDRLQDFLEYVLQVKTKSHSIVYKTLLEHYLSSWNALERSGSVSSAGRTRQQYEQAAMRLLKDADSSFNRDQLLILCQAHNFKAGILHLLEESRMYQQIVQYHMRQRDLKSVLACCRRYGQQDPSLWVQALWFFARDSQTSSDILEEILQVIEKQKSMPPLMVLDALYNAPDISLAAVRSYLLKVLQAENTLMKSEQNLVKKYREESQRIRDQIEKIQTSAMVFQLARCSACNHPLELPSIHFLCLHSFHQHCCQSFSENGDECPTCLPNNRKILDAVKSQEQGKELHETFHHQLDRAEDGFSHVAEYFGRGLFNRLTLVTDVLPKKQQSEPTTIAQPAAASSVRASKPLLKETAPRLGESTSLTPSQSPKLTRNAARPASPALKSSSPAIGLSVAATAISSEPLLQPEVKSARTEKHTLPSSASKEKEYDESKNPFSAKYGNPFSEGDVKPLTKGDGKPLSKGDGKPSTKGDGNPFIKGDGNPFTEGEGNPFTEGDEDPSNEESDDGYDSRLNPFSSD